ncbi:helix-loop-helix domain-containing protein [Spongorhabdus nitratireducens]
MALLLARCGHCRIIEDKDLAVAETLNREWHINQEPVLRALIRDFSRWEFGIDILTGQPVREVHLRSEIRNKLIQLADLSMFSEVKEIKLPVWSLNSFPPAEMDSIFCGYWGSKGFSKLEDSLCIGLNLSASAAKGLGGIPCCDLGRIPEAVQFILVYNRAENERKLKGCQQVIQGSEVALLERNRKRRNRSWVLHQSQEQLVEVQTNPQVRIDWQCCPASDLQLVATPGEYHLPLRMLEYLAKKKRISFCDGMVELKEFLMHPEKDRPLKYSVIFRDDYGMHCLMLRVCQDTVKNVVYCLVGDSLGSGNKLTQQIMPEIERTLRIGYPEESIHVWYPKYLLQEDFTSCHMFMLSFLAAADRGELDALMTYYKDNFESMPGISYEYPTWLLPPEVQKQIQGYSPDYFLFDSDDTDEQEEFEQERVQYARFLVSDTAQQYGFEMPKPELIYLACLQGYEQVIKAFNIEPMVLRYSYLLTFIALVRSGEIDLDSFDAVEVERKLKRRSISSDVTDNSQRAKKICLVRPDIESVPDTEKSEEHSYPFVTVQPESRIDVQFSRTDSLTDSGVYTDDDSQQLISSQSASSVSTTVELMMSDEEDSPDDGAVRMHHAALERARRHTGKGYLDGLKEVIPGCTPRTSKADTLQMALTCLCSMPVPDGGKSIDFRDFDSSKVIIKGQKSEHNIIEIKRRAKNTHYRNELQKVLTYKFKTEVKVEWKIILKATEEIGGYYAQQDRSAAVLEIPGSEPVESMQ